MGAWDGTSFGNDTANDWVYDLEETDDLSLIEATLAKIMEAGDSDIDARDAEEAIAAAEVLAWLCGHPSDLNSYTEKVSAWVRMHPIDPPKALLDSAAAALTRIQTEPSELLDIWADQDEWSRSMRDLRSRLTE